MMLSVNIINKGLCIKYDLLHATRYHTLKARS